MNYIKQLQAENAELRQALDAARDEIAAFRAHLHSAKFAGVESDGSRKDWIATADVFARLANINDALEAR